MKFLLLILLATTSLLQLQAQGTTQQIDFDGIWLQSTTGNSNTWGTNQYLDKDWEFFEQSDSRKEASTVRGIHGGFSFGLNDVSSDTLYMTYNGAEKILDFSFWAIRLGNNQSSSFNLDYSVNGGSTWSNTSNSAYSVGGTWQQIQFAFPNNGVQVPAGDLILRIRNINNRDLAIDDFFFTEEVPVITASPTTLTNFSYVLGSGPSAIDSFVVDGTNLSPASGSLSVALVNSNSSAYELSTSPNSGFGASASLAYSSGTLADTKIYVRMKSGLSVGNYAEDIEVSGGNASTVTVSLDGDVVSPTITVTPSTLNSFLYMIGNGPSSSQFVTVACNNATGSVTVTGTTNYEVSADNNTFSGSVTLSPAAGGVNQDVYIRMKANLPIGTYNGESVTFASSGAATQSVVCNGEVIYQIVDPAFINEASQGKGGTVGNGNNQSEYWFEYIEIVVAGGGCTTVDMRGIIIDDNNGIAAACNGFGNGVVTTGHYRFANVAQWATVPSGSIIVLYNGLAKNPAIPTDDPTDANGDSVYILPYQHASLMQENALYPNSSNCSYTNGTYTTPDPTQFRAFMANVGDAIQLRYPDGSYLHGISYTGNTNGGPNGLNVTPYHGDETVYFFSGGDFRDVSNWGDFYLISNPDAETPGETNNASNTAFVTGITGCFLLSLPTEYQADCDGHALSLQWENPLYTDGPLGIEWMTADGQTATNRFAEGSTSALMPIPADAVAWKWWSTQDNPWNELDCTIKMNISWAQDRLINGANAVIYDAMGRAVATCDTYGRPTCGLAPGWYVAQLPSGQSAPFTIVR